MQVACMCLQSAVPGPAGPGSSSGEQAAILHPREVLASVSLVGQHSGEHTWTAGCSRLLPGFHRPSGWTDQGNYHAPLPSWWVEVFTSIDPLCISGTGTFLWFSWTSKESKVLLNVCDIRLWFHVCVLLSVTVYYEHFYSFCSVSHLYFSNLGLIRNPVEISVNGFSCCLWIVWFADNYKLGATLYSLQTLPYPAGMEIGGHCCWYAIR